MWWWGFVYIYATLNPRRPEFRISFSLNDFTAKMKFSIPEKNVHSANHSNQLPDRVAADLIGEEMKISFRVLNVSNTGGRL